MSIKEDIEQSRYHPLQEDILKLVRGTTLNTNGDTFFRIVIASNLTQIAGAMRAVIEDCYGEETIINMYACGVMPSGSGKSQAQTKVLDYITSSFKKTLENKLLPATHQAVVYQQVQSKLFFQNTPATATMVELESKPIEDEYKSYGSFLWRLSGGTEAAVRQERKKIQLQGCGALNVFVDEIGYNLIANQSLNILGLCLYDKGAIEASITKNTKENTRYPERDIPIPVNFLWMGDPTKLFDSGETEKAFLELLASGFARRTLFGTGNSKSTDTTLTPQEVLDIKRTAFDPALRDTITNTITDLADSTLLNVHIKLEEPELLYLIEYDQYCKARADKVSEITDNTYKIELSERMYKTLKLAGTYAFMDRSPKITKEHLLYAMKLAEDSGKALFKMLHPERPYVKLAKYLSTVDEPKSTADISEALPFFKTPKLQSELLDRACEWGYSHDISIKTLNRGKLVFYYGEVMNLTDLDKLKVSVSNHEAYHYQNDEIPFNRLKAFGSKDGFHWCVHHFTYDPVNVSLGNTRADKNITSGFNLLVLDLDHGDKLSFIQEVLKDYKYVAHTTKRHSDIDPRYRVIIPMKYELRLSKEDYAQFMLNVYDSLPFSGIDAQTKDRARKWCTCAGTVIEHPEGKLFDPRPFIPNTSENEIHQTQQKKYGNIDKIQKWFLQHMENGNRNCMMIKYALMLFDRGVRLEELEKEVLTLNTKIDNPLPVEEIENTIFKTIRNKY